MVAELIDGRAFAARLRASVRDLEGERDRARAELAAVQQRLAAAGEASETLRASLAEKEAEVDARRREHMATRAPSRASERAIPRPRPLLAAKTPGRGPRPFRARQG